MAVPKIKVKRVRPEGRLPAYMTTGAAGADLYAALAQEVSIEPGHRAEIPTGIAIELPVGFEAQVRPRSGLALRHGVTLLNAPGTIDSDYRGEIRVLIVNHGDGTCIIRGGDRIAQLVVAPVIKAELEWTSSLAPSERGTGGFGHTG